MFAIWVATSYYFYNDWDDHPPKTYESSFIHHDILRFGKQHSRNKAILSSIVFSQQCCEAWFIPLTVVKPLWDLSTSIIEIASPTTLQAPSAPDI